MGAAIAAVCCDSIALGVFDSGRDSEVAEPGWPLLLGVWLAIAGMTVINHNGTRVSSASSPPSTGLKLVVIALPIVWAAFVS